MKNNEYEHYFDGIAPELEKHDLSLTPEQLEAEIEEEKKKCENLKSW